MIQYSIDYIQTFPSSSNFEADIELPSEISPLCLQLAQEISNENTEPECPQFNFSPLADNYTRFDYKGFMDEIF